MMMEDGRAGPTMIAAGAVQPTGEAERGRHPGFPNFNAVAVGPAAWPGRSAVRVPIPTKVFHEPDGFVCLRNEVQSARGRARQEFSLPALQRANRSSRG